MTSSDAGLVLPGAVAIVLAMQLVLGAYDGWAGAVYFTGEDRDPQRNPPRAIIGGVLTVIVIYLLMNIALMRVLPFGNSLHRRFPWLMQRVAGRVRREPSSSRSSLRSRYCHC